jgi:hypothetical protein
MAPILHVETSGLKDKSLRATFLHHPVHGLTLNLTIQLNGRVGLESVELLPKDFMDFAEILKNIYNASKITNSTPTSGREQDDNTPDGARE